MGMIACYMAVSKKQLDELNKCENDDLINALEELEEDEDTDICDLDKMWDGLHCLLTSVSAVEPIEGNLLSEAVVGTSTYCSDDGSDFIAYIYPDRLNEIVKALEDVDVKKLKANFSAKDFAKKEIYPDIWLNEDEQDLFDELVSYHEELTTFYKATAKNEMGILVSIL